MDPATSFDMDSNLLMISDALAMNIIYEILTQGLERRASIDRLRRDTILLCLLMPDHPGWCEFIDRFDDPSFMSLLMLGLRFHIGSSVLWRLRSFIVGKMEVDCRDEAKLVGELARFKDFNYHLFHHWTLLYKSPSDVDISILRQFIISHPSNFSPFHVLLDTIRHSNNPCESATFVVSNIDLPCSIRNGSRAYRDFMVSLILLLDTTNKQNGVSGLLIGVFDPFVDSAREYLDID
jgi:hypothetical protein